MKPVSPRSSSESTTAIEEKKDQRETEISWNAALEKLLCEEAEKCSGLAWLHARSELLMSGRNNYLQIPIIILSTVVGAASVGSSSLFPDNPGAASVGLGAVSILVSVLGMLSSHYSFGKKSEGHKLGSIQYAQIHRTVQIEMALPREQRMHPKQLLRFVKDDLKRLMENIPRVPQSIIEIYKLQIVDKSSGEIAHPDITNGVHKIQSYIPPLSEVQEEEAITIRIRNAPG